ncbi:MAG: tRNA 2-selenouridine(34) synthase MnmH [Cyanobacteriota bacterium]|nr:tRNA 2-selenouridine(34) synthase MnmH [Cyanobacteriota bacterium]
MSGMGDARTLTIEQLRAEQGPLVDVRSPAEFEKGHWPGAINVPLFTDAERAAVGTAYKQQGRLPAVHLGLDITGPKLSSLAGALEQLRTLGNPRIYCWRGGMRSASMAWLATQIDLSPRLLTGGYKTYRHWVQTQFEQPWPLRLMGGRTGTGKTDLLLALQQRAVAVVDLEGLAHHRGSAFGGLGLPPQPSTEHYENRLAECLDQHRQNGAASIWLEAESVQVGCCRIPKALFDQMQTAPVLEIQRGLTERVNQLVGVYGHQGGEGLAEATRRISRRLGPQRTAVALKAIEAGDWATACRATLDYYDRCYDHELARSPKRRSVDLNGLSVEQAADHLITAGLLV